MPTVVVGLLALSVGLWGVSMWWYSVEELLRGLVPLLLVAFGLVSLMAGVSRVKDQGDTDKRARSDKDLMDELNRDGK